MKKILIFIVLVCACFSLASCNLFNNIWGTNTSPNTSTKTSNVQSTSTTASNVQSTTNNVASSSNTTTPTTNNNNVVLNLGNRTYYSDGLEFQATFSNNTEKTIYGFKNVNIKIYVNETLRADAYFDTINTGEIKNANIKSKPILFSYTSLKDTNWWLNNAGQITMTYTWSYEVINTPINSTTTVPSTTRTTTSTGTSTTTVPSTTRTTTSTRTSTSTVPTTTRTTTSTRTSTTTVPSTTRTTTSTRTSEKLYVNDKGMSNPIIYTTVPTVSKIESDLAAKFETNGNVTHGLISNITAAYIAIEYHFSKGNEEITKWLKYIIIPSGKTNTGIYPCVDAYCNGNHKFLMNINEKNELVLCTAIYNPTNSNKIINHISGLNLYINTNTNNNILIAKSVNFPNCNVTVNSKKIITHNLTFTSGDYYKTTFEKYKDSIEYVNMAYEIFSQVK